MKLQIWSFAVIQHSLYLLRTEKKSRSNFFSDLNKAKHCQVSVKISRSNDYRAVRYQSGVIFEYALAQLKQRSLAVRIKTQPVSCKKCKHQHVYDRTFILIPWCSLLKKDKIIWPQKSASKVHNFFYLWWRYQKKTFLTLKLIDFFEQFHFIQQSLRIKTRTIKFVRFIWYSLYSLKFFRVAFQFNKFVCYSFYYWEKWEILAEKNKRFKYFIQVSKCRSWKDHWSLLIPLLWFWQKSLAMNWFKSRREARLWLSR